MPSPTLFLPLLLLVACGDKDSDTGTTTHASPSGACAAMSSVFDSADTVAYGESDGIVFGVSALEKGPDGCLWLSTLGAQRFNGEAFSLFDTSNTAMVSVQIRSFAFADGLVWAAHENGQLDSFDGEAGGGTNHGEVAFDVARFDSSGALWSTPDYPEQVLRVYEANGDLTTYSPKDFGATAVMILDMSPDQETLWMVDYAGEHGNLVEVDTATRTATLHPFPSPWIYTGVGRVDADGALWFATNQYELLVFDGSFSVYPFPELSYTRAARDTDGSVIWVGATITSATTTETSLYRFTGGAVSAERVLHSGDIYAQPTGFVVDLDGNYWMGTQGGALIGALR